ncbi:MAG: hypothetical protein KC656_08245, partial [Myxococcales bacterium]|nr:hypothetical protein [Myxococcales bacterium]
DCTRCGAIVPRSFAVESAGGPICQPCEAREKGVVAEDPGWETLVAVLGYGSIVVGCVIAGAVYFSG